MNIKMLRINIGIVVEPDNGGFHAYCPGLKGLHVDGATEEEALKNARNAAHAYLTSIVKHNDPIPLGIVEYDKEHSFSVAFSRLFSRKPTQYIEEIALAA
jgi:predicted RNase H-like HicB family nuclease